MYYRRSNKFFRILFEQLLVGSVMVLLALLILFYAQGYRFNLKNFKVIKTGIVYISSSPKDAEVFIDNNVEAKKTPFSKNLNQGSYTALVVKDGYQSWEESFSIQPELVTDFLNVVLFKEAPQVSTLSDQRKISFLNAPIDIFAMSQNDNLIINNDYEIWQDNRLVTRFSSPIDKVTWYGESHILYQQGDQLRVIEKNGHNDTLLVKLSSSDPTNFAVNSKGDELYFYDNGEYKIANIR